MANTQYIIATTLAAPAIWLYLKWRQLKGKEDKTRLPERFGHASTPRPSGKLWWLHAASVGEAVSLLPLLEQIHQRAPNTHLLLTTGTVSSANMLRDTLPGHVIHQFIPVDTPGACKRFIQQWQPELAIFTESELWPNLITKAKENGTTLALINARMSEKSFRHWKILDRMARYLLSSFSLIAAQTPADATRFETLGAQNVKQLGHLKQDATELPADADEVASWQAAIGKRPCLVAASFHPSEDELLAALHAALKTELPNLLTILVPRHPPRAQGMAQSFKENKLRIQLRSEQRELIAATDCYIADTIGELGLWYRLADVVIMGGSFIPHGGQNPLEPIRLAKPTVIGPHAFNFQTITDGLAEARGIHVLDSSDTQPLTKSIKELLADKNVRNAMVDRANKWLANSPPVARLLTEELSNLTSKESA